MLITMKVYKSMLLGLFENYCFLFLLNYTTFFFSRKERILNDKIFDKSLINLKSNCRHFSDLLTEIVDQWLSFGFNNSFKFALGVFGGSLGQVYQPMGQKCIFLNSIFVHALEVFPD